MPACQHRDGGTRPRARPASLRRFACVRAAGTAPAPREPDGWSPPRRTRRDRRVSDGRVTRVTPPATDASDRAVAVGGGYIVPLDGDTVENGTLLLRDGAV